MVMCERFPALSPFSVRHERFRDVLRIFVNMAGYDKEKNLHKANGGGAVPEGSFMLNGTLYKPAQNDDWM